MRRARRAARAALAAALAAACRGEPAAAPAVLAEADTVVAPESELLGVPVDLAVDGSGRVYVLDNALGRIVRLEDGARPTVLGRRGGGPGEMEGPLALRVDGDSIRVDDRGNGRALVLAADGAPVRSFPLPPRSPGALAFGARGEAAVATSGLSAAGLAVRLDAAGEPRGTLGALLAPPVRILNFTAMKADVRRGRIPAVLRNAAIPVFGEGGGAWLVLAAEGAVRRYDAGGREVWSRPVRTPEVRAIRERFFSLNRAEKSPYSFYPLAYFADAAAVGEELWLLVNTPEEEPSVVLVLEGGGKLARRYILPGVFGARDLAVDEARGRLYLSVPSSAALLSVRLPPT
ncbi:MAG TPA: hypothetical protein VF746_03030 [Longimicrobium sp.]